MEKLNYRKEIEARLIAKALKDEAFRQSLLTDPKGVVESELGVKIPDTITIKIIEEKENEVCLLIPHFKESAEEISDVELEEVAGGWTGAHSWCDLCKYTEDPCYQGP